jgi:sugar-specific transcriptional regulator TrmB
MVIEKLQKLGLSHKEALVYMALFELGSSVVTELAKRAQINRSTAYVLIESLSHRGLVSVSERRGIKIFSPVAPDKLTKIAEARFAEASELLKIGKELSSDLKKLSPVGKTGTKTKVNVFDGKEGVKTLYNNIFSTKGHIDAVISNGKGKTATEKQLFDLNSCLEKGADLRIMAPDTTPVREQLRQMEISKGQEILLAQESDGEYFLGVYENKVAFIASTDETSFVAESSQFANAIRRLYELAVHKTRRWNVEKDFNDKTPGVRAPEKDKALVRAEKRFWSGR